MTNEEVMQTMMVGMMGPFYPVPPEIADSQRVEWLIERASTLGLTALQVSVQRRDPDYLRSLRELGETKGIQLETDASGVFGLVGPQSDDSRARLTESIETARLLGCRLIRTAYGGPSLETSQFNKEIPLSKHLDLLKKNLKEAASVVQDSGLVLAIENHCDFPGRQLAEVLDATDSAYVGAALDTGNSYTIFCDPLDDARALAPFTVTTHLKDMQIVDFGEPGRVPFVPVGCALGEGHVDIPAVVSILAETSPHAHGLPLIIEVSWVPVDPSRDRAEQMTDMFDRSIRYLRDVLQRFPASEH